MALLALLRRLGDNASPDLLRKGLRGMERECLRVTPRGCIAQTAHPSGLGSALTNPYITTDYSEALLEFVTPPRPDSAAALDLLTDIHRFTYRHIGDELLWATSMPCILGDENSIPIAEYGTSNVGLMKNIYRRGLGHRYGRKMQTIAGIHFNFSVTDDLWPVLQSVVGDTASVEHFRDSRYFGLVRNFQRLGWLVPLLFGASPAVCRSFLGGRVDGLETHGRNTLYAPYATSLRMSDLGYKNKAQSGLAISANSLDDYVDGLVGAIQTPDPEFEAIGMCKDGEYLQLSTSILQIENEYYSFIRPKNRARSGERPTLALRRRGVQYVEMRALDIDPDAAAGVTQEALYFLEALLLYCLLEDSPLIDDRERRENEHNQTLVAREGRSPGLMLERGNEYVALDDWAAEIMEGMSPLCEFLDRDLPDSPYTASLTAQRRKLSDFALTPSAQQLRLLLDENTSFFDYAMRQSLAHKEWLQNTPLPAERLDALETAARQSLLDQREMEAADTLDFSTYLASYYANG